MIKARHVLLALPPMLVVASGLLAVFHDWLWSFWLLGVAIWIEIGL